MNALLSRCAVLLVCVSVAACGFDDKKERDPRPADDEEKAAIDDIMNQATVMRSLVETGDNAADVVVAVDYQPYKVLLDSAATANDPAAFELPAPFPDCATITATTATFTDCEHMGHTVNGTVTLEGNPVTGASLSASLTDVFTLTNGTTGSAALSGSGTISDTSLNGSITVEADVDPANFDPLTLDASVQWMNIQTDAQWCPTSGTLVVSGTLDQGIVSFNRTVEVTFGPNCGDAELLLR